MPLTILLLSLDLLKATAHVSGRQLREWKQRGETKVLRIQCGRWIATQADLVPQTARRMRLEREDSARCWKNIMRSSGRRNRRSRRSRKRKSAKRRMRILAGGGRREVVVEEEEEEEVVVVVVMVGVQHI
jgi:hypothetical protein